MQRRTLLLTAGIAFLAGALSAADPAAYWNQIATDQTAATLDPVNETRVLAMTHIAMHDALNAVERRYESYLYRFSKPEASPVAAVAAAARNVLMALLPARRAQIDRAYAEALAQVPDSDAKAQGVEAGLLAAQSILAQRASDGATDTVPPRLGTRPGEYRPTAPDFIPAGLPHWGRVTPFGLRQSSQFRPPAPPALDGPEYAEAYNEVRRMGEANSRARTAAQSEIARYWYENSGLGWNRIARVVTERGDLGLWESARLFALLNIAMADGFIGGFEAKYHYDTWRPITAIGEGDADGNTGTTAVRDWTPFLVTPPVPDYPSTHSVLGAAAARVLAHAFGTDFVQFRMTSGAPFEGITRRFFSFSQAAHENAASRVLAGLHFGTACRAGLRQGEQIGDYVSATLLPAVK